MGYNAAQELYRRVQANLVKKRGEVRNGKLCIWNRCWGYFSKMRTVPDRRNSVGKMGNPTRTENGGSEILPDIAKSVKAKMAEKGIAADDVAGVGIDVPGG